MKNIKLPAFDEEHFFDEIENKHARVITVEGAHNIDKVIDDLGLNDELSQLLYELFQ